MPPWTAAPKPARNDEFPETAGKPGQMRSPPEWDADGDYLLLRSTLLTILRHMITMLMFWPCRMTQTC